GYAAPGWLSQPAGGCHNREMSDALPHLDDAAIRSWIVHNVPAEDFAGKRLLLIVPDSTRTAPLPLLFDALFHHLRPHVAAFDVMVALGTHPPMSEAAICRLLGIDPQERQRLFAQTQLFNHEWDNPTALMTIGTFSKADTEEMSDGLLSVDVPVQINAEVGNYDVLLVLGPVFPHEVVGFSGGNKYFFPGIAGPDIIDLSHWLGALLTNVEVIGAGYTPVRALIDRAAALIPSERLCLAAVVRSGTKDLHALAFGTPEAAWAEASEVSARTHVRYLDRPYRRVLSIVSERYDELWTASKGMYKLEPVVADGGELVLYAPHVREISRTHGEAVRKVGYHCMAYFLAQPE